MAGAGGWRCWSCCCDLRARLAAGSRRRPPGRRRSCPPTRCSTCTSRPTRRGRPCAARSRAAGAAARTVAPRSTRCRSGIVAVVGGSAGTSSRRDIRPWLGSEAAFALLNTPGAIGRLADRARRARPRAGAAFLARQGAQPPGATGARRCSLSDRRRAGLRRATIWSSGQTPTCARRHRRRRRRRPRWPPTRPTSKPPPDEPAGRVLDAYALGGRRARACSTPAPGSLGALGALLASPALSGVAARSSRRSARAGRCASTARSTAPSAAARHHAPDSRSTRRCRTCCRPGSTLMLDARNLRRAAPTVLGRHRPARPAQPGSRSAAPARRRAARRRASTCAGLLDLFSGETAVALAARLGARPALVIVTPRPATSHGARRRWPASRRRWPSCSPRRRLGRRRGARVHRRPGRRGDRPPAAARPRACSSTTRCSTALSWSPPACAGSRDVAARAGRSTDDPGYRAVLGEPARRR